MNVMARLFIGGFLGGTAYWFWRYFAPESSDFMLEDRVVVVTGASSGIGRALALAFARRGARVVLVARRKELLDSVEQEIEPYAGGVLKIQADLTSARQRERVVSRTLKTFGRLDVLVNNAGVSWGGYFEEQENDSIEAIIELNLKSAILLTRLVLPVMTAQNEGYIVNIGSSLSRSAAPGFSSYVASKFGLAGFSDSLRRELSGKNIRVLLALPSWTRSEMLPDEVALLIEKLPGQSVEEAQKAAERIVEGLVRGARELPLGSPLMQMGLLAERYLPGIMNRLYWRQFFAKWMNVMKKIGGS